LEIITRKINAKSKYISFSLEIIEMDFNETKKIVNKDELLWKDKDQEILILKNEKERLDNQIVEIKNKLHSPIKLKDEYAFYLSEITTKKQNIE